MGVDSDEAHTVQSCWSSLASSCQWGWMPVLKPIWASVQSCWTAVWGIITVQLTVMMPDCSNNSVLYGLQHSPQIDSDDARLLLQLCTIWASAQSIPIDSDDARLPQQLCTEWASSQSTPIDRDDARLQYYMGFSTVHPH